MNINDFSKDILKIPNGSTVQIFELERQLSIYKELKEEYNIHLGLLEVLR